MGGNELPEPNLNRGLKCHDPRSTRLAACVDFSQNVAEALIHMRWTLQGFAFVLLVLTSVGCASEDGGSTDATAIHEPDRVVGIIIRCQLGSSGIGLAGEECTELGASAVGLVKELTVRTATGSSYVVSLGRGDDLFDQIRLGDVWPP